MRNNLRGSSAALQTEKRAGITAFLLFALVMSVGLAPRSAHALPLLLDNTNVTSLALGDPVLGFTGITSNFVAPGGEIIGTLTVDVYKNAGTGIHSYLLTVSPDPAILHQISEFTVNYNVLGLDPIGNPNLKVGYRFSDAATAGAGALAPGDGSNAFDIFWDPAPGPDQGKIQYTVSEALAVAGIPFWDLPPRVVPITFFFQTPNEPGATGEYFVINAVTGGTVNQAPGPIAQVPEPSTLLLLGLGLVSVAFLERSFL